MPSHYLIQRWPVVDPVIHVWLLGKNSEIWIVHTLSFKKMHLEMSSANGNHFASASKCFQQTNESFIALFWHCKINPAKPSGASWRHNLWPSPTMEKYFSHTNGTHCHNFQCYYHYRYIDMLIIRSNVKPELIFNLLKSNYHPKLPTCGGTAESAIIREILCNLCWGQIINHHWSMPSAYHQSRVHIWPETIKRGLHVTIPKTDIYNWVIDVINW